MKKHTFILGCLQAFVALGAIPAAIIYLIDPSGKAMGQSSEMLAHSPFPDFLVPALFLLIVNGFGSVAGAVLTFLNNPLAALSGMALGIILCTWILLQVYWIGLSSFLQPMLFIIGAAEIWFGYVLYSRHKPAQ